MNKELLGVSYVETAVSRTDYLVPHFERNDRTASWDGDVEVYNKASNNHSKNNLISKVPVQIKCHEADANNLFYDNISFAVNINDLKNYLNAGGTIFFVVYIDSTGVNHCIYYAELLPFQLKRILETKNKKTKNIKLNVFPNQNLEISNIFLNFAKNMNRQKTAITAEPITLTSLKEDGRFQGISFGYIDVAKDAINPFGYMFNHSTYLYAKLPYNIEIPIEYMSPIDSAEMDMVAPVCVGEDIFYTKYKVIFKKNKYEFCFGKSVQYIYDHEKQECKFNFNLKGNLSERIIAVSFIIASIENLSFSVNGTIIRLDGVKSEEIVLFNLEEGKLLLRKMKRVKEILDELKINDELDMDDWTEQDEENLTMFIIALGDKRPVPLKDIDCSIGVLKISNLSIWVSLKKECNSNLYRICNIYDDPPYAEVSDGDGNKFETSVYVLLKKDDFKRLSNINFEEIKHSIKNVNISQGYINQVAWFGLQVILAYDEDADKDSRLLDLAQNIFDWLISNDSNDAYEIHILNLLQIKKRHSVLDRDDISKLCNIAEDSRSTESMKTAAYLLMENRDAAEIHFNKMSIESQEEFMGYPIYHFWNTEGNN